MVIMYLLMLEYLQICFTGYLLKGCFLKADIRALIFVTGKDCVYTGYRPAHLLGGNLTTGVHEYIDSDHICNGDFKEGFFTFISPESYPHTIKVGDILSFQDGSNIVGYAEVLEIFNELFNHDSIS